MHWTAVFSGAAGALAIQLLGLMEIKNIPKDKRPDLKDIYYWVYFFGAPVLGGFVCWAYAASDYTIKPLLGINLGASFPLILRAMASAIPKGYEPPTGA
jgi:hypothetical protein